METILNHNNKLPQDIIVSQDNLHHLIIPIIQLILTAHPMGRAQQIPVEEVVCNSRHKLEELAMLEQQMYQT